MDESVDGRWEDGEALLFLLFIAFFGVPLRSFHLLKLVYSLVDLFSSVCLRLAPPKGVALL